ncbi:MAG: DUF2190 family protein [Sphaerochaeta sp.]|jgi:hypothetical protein|nr:DUF2190 family protein [Sphaerochaeta sp.]
MGYNIKPVLTESFVSTNDLRLNQYYGVKLSADRTVILPTGDADNCIGILQNKPNAGEMAEVMVIGRTPVVVEEAIAAGVQIRIASGGKASTFVPDTDTTAFSVGQVVEHASNDAELADAIVNFATQDRGEE